MANRKKKVTRKKSVSPKSKIRTMATKRKRRRRPGTSVRRALSATARKSGTRRRRRKRGLSAALSMSNIITHAKHNSAGAVGGGLFTATRMVSMPMWIRVLVGYGGSMALSMMNAPFVGAGLAGATTSHLAERLLPIGMLNDGEELEDTEYVDPSTLSDTGMCDDNGNDILMDNDGIAYALNDSGELEAIGEGSDIQGVSMIPLSDPYALNDAYQLSSAY
jgi:hypothetical protein